MAETHQEEVRLAEVLASLSLATDLGMGQPMEKALRSTLVAVRLGEALGLPDELLSDVYYLALLLHLGCTSLAPEMAAWMGGDEIAFRTHAITFPMSSMGKVMAGLARHIGPGRPFSKRAGLFLVMVVDGQRRDSILVQVQCETGAMLAQRLGLSDGVVRSLGHFYERWDGKGAPARLRGEAIPLPLRVVSVAHDVEVFHRVGGWSACAEALRARRGRSYDPTVVDRMLERGEGLLASLPSDSCWDEVLACEPSPHHSIGPERLDTFAAACGDFSDLKSPFMVGHSSGVASLVEAGSRIAGLDDASCRRLRQAALLHDIGRVAVPNGIWDKPGRLTTSEFERVRMHPYYSERILAGSPPLASLASLVGTHHERLDGTGYHRGSKAPQLSFEHRLLAASDVYQAMIQDRPHRAALSRDQAAAELEREAMAGRLDPEAVRCVLEAVGRRGAVRRRRLPAGLTEREVEVLRLTCSGRTNKQMAARLHISDRTVGHHVAHIYDKIGVSTRAGAALFAMAHGLVEDPY